MLYCKLTVSLYVSIQNQHGLGLKISIDITSTIDYLVKQILEHAFIILLLYSSVQVRRPNHELQFCSSIYTSMAWFCIKATINYESLVKALYYQGRVPVLWSLNGCTDFILPASSLKLSAPQHSKGPTTRSRPSHDLGNSNNFSTELKDKIEKAKSYQDKVSTALTAYSTWKTQPSGEKMVECGDK